MNKKERKRVAKHDVAHRALEEGGRLNACLGMFWVPLPVWSCRTSIARFVDLGVQRLQGRAAVREARRRVGTLGTLREVVVVGVRVQAAAVHRRVQRPDAGVGVLLVRAEGGADDVLDLGVFSLFGLLLPKLSCLGLYSGRRAVKIERQVGTVL